MPDEVTEVTPAGQDEAGVSFDEHGELKFSEAGLDAFKDLLKLDVHDNTVRPTQEAIEEDTKEKPEEEKEPEKKPEPVKRKLKVEGQEIEKTEEEITALAQQGLHYTQRMQALAEKERGYAPYDALIAQLKTDPALSQHIAGYWKPQPEKEPEKPKFDDPIEQLKWETRQEIMADVRKEMQQAIIPLNRQQALNQVKAQIQADPDYHAVHGAIMGQVMDLPGANELIAALQIARESGEPPDLSRVRNSLAKNAYLQLDQDPASYVEAFQAQKAKLAAGKKPVVPDKPIIEKPGETKRTERAPILESSNNMPTETTLKSERAKIDKAKAKVLREGSVDALQNFLEVGGFLDHLR